MNVKGKYFCVLFLGKVSIITNCDDKIICHSFSISLNIKSSGNFQCFFLLIGLIPLCQLHIVGLNQNPALFFALFFHEFYCVLIPTAFYRAFKLLRLKFHVSPDLVIPLIEFSHFALVRGTRSTPR